MQQSITPNAHTRVLARRPQNRQPTHAAQSSTPSTCPGNPAGTLLAQPEFSWQSFFPNRLLSFAFGLVAGCQKDRCDECIGRIYRLGCLLFSIGVGELRPPSTTFFELRSIILGPVVSQWEVWVWVWVWGMDSSELWLIRLL